MFLNLPHFKMDFPNKDADFTTEKEIEIFKKFKGKQTLYTGQTAYLLVNGIRHIESIQVEVSYNGSL